MFTIALAAVMAAAVPAVEEDWRLLLRTDHYAAGIDAASILAEGSVANARLLTVPRGKPEGADEIRAMAVLDVEVDCAARRKRVTGRLIIDAAGNEIARADDADARWEPVLADTPVAALAAVVCDARPLDKRGARDPVAFARSWQANAAE